MLFDIAWSKIIKTISNYSKITNLMKFVNQIPQRIQICKTYYSNYVILLNKDIGCLLVLLPILKIMQINCNLLKLLLWINIIVHLSLAINETILEL